LLLFLVLPGSFPLVPEILSKHDEMEELLESYLIDFNALESKMELTRNQIQNAEELVSSSTCVCV
jgi:hypothetical protein